MSFNKIDINNLSDEEKLIIKEILAKKLQTEVEEEKPKTEIIQKQRVKKSLKKSDNSSQNRRKHSIHKSKSSGRNYTRAEPIQVGKRVKLIGGDGQTGKDSKELKSKLYPNKPMPRLRAHVDENLVEAQCTKCEYYVDVRPGLAYRDIDSGEYKCVCDACGGAA